MNWVNESRNRSVSNEGYQVLALKHGCFWHYKAEGLKRQSEKKGWFVIAYIDPVLGRMPMKERYAIGDEIPTEREALGYFREEDFGTAAQAMAAAVAACEEHFKRTSRRSEVA